LREKDAKEFLDDFSRRIGVKIQRLLGSNLRIELAMTRTAEIFLLNGRPFVARADSVLFPTLIFKAIFQFMPKIVVDMGAVPKICSGADVMAPGVVRSEGDFCKETILVVADELHSKNLAVCISLIDSNDLKEVKTGKVAKNIHYIGDKLWNLIK
jgi:PUA domain protein